MCVSSPTPASGQARLGWSSLDSYSCRPHLLALPLFLCRCGLGGGVCFPGDGLGTGSWARTSFITLLAFALLGRRRERWGSTCVPWSQAWGLRSTALEGPVITAPVTVALGALSAAVHMLGHAPPAFPVLHS